MLMMMNDDCLKLMLRRNDLSSSMHQVSFSGCPKYVFYVRFGFIGFIEQTHRKLSTFNLIKSETRQVNKILKTSTS